MNWAYVAGFTDGDGCISMEFAAKTDGRRYHFSRLRWSQKESASIVLDELAAFLKTQGLKISERNFSVAREGHKFPQRELTITNAEDTRRALREMLPYLILKRDRALLALEILDNVHRLKAEHGNKYRLHVAQAALI